MDIKFLIRRNYSYLLRYPLKYHLLFNIIKIFFNFPAYLKKQKSFSSKIIYDSSRTPSSPNVVRNFLDQTSRFLSCRFHILLHEQNSLLLKSCYKFNRSLSPSKWQSHKLSMDRGWDLDCAHPRNETRNEFNPCRLWNERESREQMRVPERFEIRDIPPISSAGCQYL